MSRERSSKSDIQYQKFRVTFSVSRITLYAWLCHFQKQTRQMVEATVRTRKKKVSEEFLFLKDWYSHAYANTSTPDISQSMLRQTRRLRETRYWRQVSKVFERGCNAGGKDVKIWRTNPPWTLTRYYVHMAHDEPEFIRMTEMIRLTFSSNILTGLHQVSTRSPTLTTVILRETCMKQL